MHQIDRDEIIKEEKSSDFAIFTEKLNMTKKKYLNQKLCF